SSSDRERWSPDGAPTRAPTAASALRECEVSARRPEVRGRPRDSAPQGRGKDLRRLRRGDGQGHRAVGQDIGRTRGDIRAQGRAVRGGGMTRRWTLFVLLLAASPAALSAQTPAAQFARTDTARLHRTLDSLAAAHRGVVGYNVTNIDTGERLALRGDSTFPTASLIKMSLLVTLFDLVEKDSISLD